MVPGSLRGESEEADGARAGVPSDQLGEFPAPEGSDSSPLLGNLGYDGKPRTALVV